MGELVSEDEGAAQSAPSALAWGSPGIWGTGVWDSRIGRVRLKRGAHCNRAVEAREGEINEIDPCRQPELFVEAARKSLGSRTLNLGLLI